MGLLSCYRTISAVTQPRSQFWAHQDDDPSYNMNSELLASLHTSSIHAMNEPVHVGKNVVVSSLFVLLGYFTQAYSIQT